jgi:hypothetical protein
MKKAQIEFYLFILTTLFLCGFSIFIYISANKDLTFESTNIKSITSEVEFAEDYVRDIVDKGFVESKSSCSVDDFKKFFAKRDISYYNAGNIFGLIRTDAFSLQRIDGICVLEIKGINIVVNRGNSEVVRKFDLLLKSS